MDPSKYSYYIEGCRHNFEEVDEGVYLPTLSLDGGEHYCKHHGCMLIHPYSGSELVAQTISLDVPDEIFDPDMEYVCVRQDDFDTALEIVSEDDIKPGNRAVRIMLPRHYFHNRMEQYKYSHPHEEVTIDGFKNVRVDLYVGIGLYISIE